MILIDHQSINQPTGTRDYGPANVADGLTSATLRLARCTSASPTFWPNQSTQVIAQAWISFDGGVTFPYLAVPLAGKGGIVTNPKTGVEVQESGVRFTGVPLGSGRMIKATVAVTNGPLVSQITVEVA